MRGENVKRKCGKERSLKVVEEEVRVWFDQRTKN